MINLFQILLGSFWVSLAPADELVVWRVSKGATFVWSKRTQNHVGRGVALRVPCAVRQFRRWRKLAEPVLSLAEGLRQCAPVFPESAALLGHTKGLSKKGQKKSQIILV